jgi:hypothetical protein
MSDLSRYDHATELSQSQPPVVKLDYLVNELKAWAELNPPLKVLHSEFAGLLREMKEAGKPLEGDVGAGPGEMLYRIMTARDNAYPHGVPWNQLLPIPKDEFRRKASRIVNARGQTGGDADAQ